MSAEIHTTCKHGDAKSFLDALLKALETRDIKYEFSQDYRYGENGLIESTSVRIFFDQFVIPEDEDVLDYLNGIIYELGREARFDPASCSYLEEQTDRWIFEIPGWHFGDRPVCYIFTSGTRIYRIGGD